MNISEAIEFLDTEIANPSLGLPEELFIFISRITPMVNVDLLIKDENKKENSIVRSTLVFFKSI